MASTTKRSTAAKGRNSGGNLKIIILLAIIVLDIILIVTLSNAGKGKKIDYSKYPMEYTEMIRQHARENALDPAYVGAIILAESSYNPEAVSSVNAQGLMQLLPSTAEWIAGKFGEEYHEGCLFDPDTNIKYGCWYLGYLNERFGGDMRCVTAAYHAGQGTVSDWLSNSQYSADGKTLDVIPGSNTNTYVDRVTKYYEVYETLYQEAAAA